MELDVAALIGRRLCEELAWGCERIEIAGSVRREKALVKDLELVVIPKMGKRPDGFWDTVEYSLFEMAVDEAVARGRLERDEQVPRWGAKYKRALYHHNGQALVVELFVARPETWGYILALRTGPADFNQVWAAYPWQGGCLPLGTKLANGEVSRNGVTLAVPSEEAFFEALGIPCWPPRDRREALLRAWLIQQQRG